MPFIRRSVYDENDFRVECRVMEEPVLDTVKLPDGKITPRVILNCVTNSNQYSSKSCCHFILQANGRKAERIFAMIHKGYGIWVKAELKEKIEKSLQKSLRKTTITRYNLFQIDKIHVIAIPNKEGTSETYTDILVDMEKVEE